jgi:predicted small lipoprotein YifL
MVTTAHSSRPALTATVALTRRGTCLLLLALPVLSACGRRGDLELPERSKSRQSRDEEGPAPEGTSQ